MKVAVMTLKDSPNYGGILQAYALQKVIEGFGHECVLIDYMNDEFRHKFTFFGRPKGMGRIYWLYKKVQYPLMRIMMKKLMPFYSYMKMTEHFCTPEDLKKLNSEYDVFIVGSDQVWACDLNYYDDSYFLGFVEDHHLKISYAASFGRTVDMIKPEEAGFISPRLEALDYISVRENSGIELVKELAGREAEEVLDPTFLLDETEWKKVASHEHKGKGKKYILCYLMQSRKNDTEALRFAKRMSRKTGKPIVKICRGLTSVLWGETIYIPTVEEWLGLFMDADYIITNSFHGMAFSINFRKNFTVFVEGSPASGRNSRIYDRCKDFGLVDRAVEVGTNHDVKENSIDYSLIDAKIEKLKKKSLQYLQDSLR